MNVLFMLSIHNFKSVGVFVFVAGCLLIYRKNIIFTLVVAMLSCNIYYYFFSHLKQHDGFKKRKKKKTTTDDSGDQTIKQSIDAIKRDMILVKNQLTTI